MTPGKVERLLSIFTFLAKLPIFVRMPQSLSLYLSDPLRVPETRGEDIHSFKFFEVPTVREKRGSLGVSKRTEPSGGGGREQSLHFQSRKNNNTQQNLIK